MVVDLEQEAVAKAAQLDALLEHVPLGIVVVDRASRRVLRLNAEAERVLALARGDDFEAGLRSRLVGDPPFLATFVDGSVVRSEAVGIEQPDGTVSRVCFTSAPVGSAGSGDVLVVVDDVTEREARARAEREFITNAAHELQTPIAAITSAIDVLQGGAKDREEDRDRFLGHIERATTRLGGLTRALLVLARAQSREEPPRTEVLRVEPLLEAVAASLAGPVTLDCPPDAAVISNRFLLELALVNLGENALRHGRDVVIAATRRHGVVEIEVRDSGSGIPAAVRDRVFDRFYRAHGGDGGFGLGLAIVREAADALGADLRLESGTWGTNVSIRLPGAIVRRS